MLSNDGLGRTHIIFDPVPSVRKTHLVKFRRTLSLFLLLITKASMDLRERIRHNITNKTKAVVMVSRITDIAYSWDGAGCQGALEIILGNLPETI